MGAQTQRLAFVDDGNAGKLYCARDRSSLAVIECVLGAAINEALVDLIAYRSERDRTDVARLYQSVECDRITMSVAAAFLQFPNYAVCNRNRISER